MGADGQEYVTVPVEGDRRGAGGLGGQAGSIFARRHLHGGEPASASAGPSAAEAVASAGVDEGHGGDERLGLRRDASRSRTSRSRSRRYAETSQSEVTTTEWRRLERLNYDSGAVSTVGSENL